MPYRRSMSTVTPARYVEAVPAVLVSILADEGKLPLVPESGPMRFGFRRPGMAELCALRWLVAWEGWRFTEQGALRPAHGVLGYEDRYDFRSSSDVRDICFLAGSRRAIADLLTRARVTAKEEGRRTIGSVRLDAVRLRRMLSRMGGEECRVVVEDVWKG